MKFVTDGFQFSFDYTNPLQDGDLLVAAEIYDVTSGAAVFVETVPMSFNEFGSYTGNFTGVKGHTYLAICLVFTSLAYVTADTQYAPESYFYHVIGAADAMFYWDYTAFDHASSLSVRTKIFKVTSGTPVLLSEIVPSYVAHGVYFARYQCEVGDSYQVLTPVYTDGSYGTVDLTRAPVSDSFQCVQFNVVNNSVSSGTVLRGTANSAKLRGVRNE